MTDVNIVAKGNTAKLLELECQRLELEYLTTSAPASEARLYIIDTELYGLPFAFSEKTIALGVQKSHKARYEIPKSFLLSELRQLIKSAMFSEPQKETSGTEKKSSAPTLLLIPKKQSVKLNGQEIILSQTEFKLLRALLDKKGEILTHEDINILIDGGTSNKANVYICFLRKKLEVGGTKIIYSVRGQGFMIK